MLLLKIFGWIIILLIDIPVMIYRGIVLSSLWLWFVVPLGVKPVGTAQALGISMLISLFTFRLDKTKKDKDDETPAWATAIFHQIAHAFVISVAWGIGSIIAGYM